MEKIYVLDTNILIQNPKSIFGFEDNKVVITSTTMQELDGLKNAPGETGYNARESIRHINDIQEHSEKDYDGNYKLNEQNGYLSFFNDTNETFNGLPHSFSLEKPDNRIINSVLMLQYRNSNSGVILVTNDISMRSNARICDVTVQGYMNDEVKEKSFTGRSILPVDYETFKEFFAQNKIPLPEVIGLNPNEYITLTCGESTGIGVVDMKNKCIRNIGTENYRPMGIEPKNLGQRCALHALLAPAEEIPLVIIKGAAGTGKTMLALAAALEKSTDVSSMNEWYHSKKKILITRNNILSDEPLGFLPGELDEKMGPLVSPFIDNLENILQRKAKNDRENIQMQIDDMLSNGVIEICSLAYMRGRSITNSYLIVDEVQNATPNQVFEIVSRAGMGTKVILLGDPDQIDNPKLDSKNNGLVVTSEKMKGSELCAQITFEESESVRSPLAKESIMRLNGN